MLITLIQMYKIIIWLWKCSLFILYSHHRHPQLAANVWRMLYRSHEWHVEVFCPIPSSFSFSERVQTGVVCSWDFVLQDCPDFKIQWVQVWRWWTSYFLRDEGRHILCQPIMCLFRSMSTLGNNADSRMDVR